MAIIRLVNTTTPLRVDAALESEFFRIIDPAFKAAIEKRSRDPYVDVQLVDRGDKDLAGDDASQTDRIPDTDFLGVYIPHSQPSHHPTIKVCPERILDACQRWSPKIGGELPFAERYPTLLNAVIIHELAHFLMDDPLVADQCQPSSWSEFIRWLNGDAVKENDEWASRPVADRECEKRIQRRLADQKDECSLKAQHIQSWIKTKSVDMKPLLDQRKVVEESLANAFVLRQSFGQRHLDALRVFIESQSAPYRAGLGWRGGISALLDTASAWRSYQINDIGLGGRLWVVAPPARRQVLEALAKRLLTSEGQTAPFYF
jgi:hypothetical protein